MEGFAFFFYNRLEAFFDRGMGEMITKDVKEQLIQVSDQKTLMTRMPTVSSIHMMRRLSISLCLMP